jgi:hypothetical protein
MRRAITLGIDSTGKTTIIHGVDVPYAEQRSEFAEARAAHSTGKWVEVLFASEFKKLRVAKPEPTSEEPKRKVK